VWVNGALVWRPWCHYPVGYSAVLGGVYWLFGSGQWIGPLFNALIGTVTIGVVHRLARQFLSANRSRAAALLTAVHPGLIAYSAVLMTEPLAALLLLLTAQAALFWRGRSAAARAGVLVGIGALVRPPSVLALLAMVASGGRTLKENMKFALIAGAVALATLAPWAARNCRVMDGCALISTNGGWNLAIGALTPTGRFHTLRAEDGCKIVTGQVQQDRCWAQIGMQTILSDPFKWLGKIPAKLEQTFSHESFAVAYLHEANPSLWPEQEVEDWRVGLSCFHLLLLTVAALATLGLPRAQDRKVLMTQLGLGVSLLGFVGYAVLTDDHPLYWLSVLIPLVGLLPLPGAPTREALERYLYLSLALTALTSAVFFGEDRYHIVISPVLCLLAAAALRPSGARATKAAA
jgi:4-amino-4-deoxy-L-arabinose transferase-like glycosyltransferase